MLLEILKYRFHAYDLTQKISMNPTLKQVDLSALQAIRQIEVKDHLSSLTV